MTQNPSSSNPRRDEKRHCLHTSAFKGEGAQIRSSKSNSMQMRQLSRLNRRLPTGGTHAFHLLAGRVLWVRRGWREGGSRGRCCLPPSSSPAELLHCGSPLKKGGQLLCLAPPPVLAVVCVLVCVCVSGCLSVLEKVHIWFQQAAVFALSCSDALAWKETDNLLPSHVKLLLNV